MTLTATDTATAGPSQTLRLHGFPLSPGHSLSVAAGELVHEPAMARVLALFNRPPVPEARIEALPGFVGMPGSDTAAARAL